MKPNNFEQKKLLCEFMGCIVYETYHSSTYSDYTIQGKMVEEFRDKGYSVKGFRDKMMFDNIEFDSSFDQLFEVWRELLDRATPGEPNNQVTKVRYKNLRKLKWYRDSINSLSIGDIEYFFKNVVEGIKWFNEQYKIEVK